MTRDDLAHEVTRTLAEMFQLDPARVTLNARLAEDLDLDSIDAIDLAAKMQELTGARLAESELRRIRTVGDVIDVVAGILEPKTKMGR